jgi:uncharacterized protein
MRFIAGLALIGAVAAIAQQTTISIEEYDPKSTLVVPQHVLTRAKYPFIDVHNHQRDTSPERLAQLIRDMDSLNMRILVDSPVNGGFGEWVKNAAANIRAFNKDRFAVYTNVDYRKIDNPPAMAAQLEEDIRNGAVGLKVWKNFGLTEKDGAGKRIPVDDPRLDSVWDVCAKHKIPVMIHTADPKPLFEEMDKYNERWLELKMRPNRAHHDVTWDQVIGEQHNLFAKHPNTIFIDAHMGWLGQLLDRCPNVYVEIGAITSELGRQPRAAHAFFVKYQDRVLFGKDAWAPAEYGVYFRLLETADEYFDPIRKYHGLWKLYGLELPDDVLKKLYYKNALRIIPGLNPAGFPK